jgi:hypothetical protein
VRRLAKHDAAVTAGKGAIDEAFKGFDQPCFDNYRKSYEDRYQRHLVPAEENPEEAARFTSRSTSPTHSNSTAGPNSPSCSRTHGGSSRSPSTIRSSISILPAVRPTPRQVCARYQRSLKKTPDGKEFCRLSQTWLTAQVKKYDWDINPEDTKNPTIHGLRGTGILTRYAQGP